MVKFDIERIFPLVKERKVRIVSSGWKHIISGELDEKCLWETLENGVLLTKEQLSKKLPHKASSYKFPYYFLHKLRKFIVLGKPVLAGFYIDKDTIKIGHFSSCSAEIKFYEQFKKESQNPAPEN